MSRPDSSAGAFVSIHAPARGATSRRGRTRRASMFQSTPPRGGRRAGKSEVVSHLWFQSTPPRGGRHQATASAKSDDRFNPRPRAGGDARCKPRPCCAVCFNPRPRAGGDGDLQVPGADRGVSIHAPARGATCGAGGVAAYITFQSTPPRGGRRAKHATYGLTSDVSIHAPARGATRARIAKAGVVAVSIHAPARGATRYISFSQAS